LFPPSFSDRANRGLLVEAGATEEAGASPATGTSEEETRLRRRYADAPAAALLTGRGAGEWSPLRFAHAPIFSASNGLRLTSLF